MFNRKNCSIHLVVVSLCLGLCCTSLLAQNENTANANNEKQLILNQIELARVQNDEELTKRIAELENKIRQIDQSLEKDGSSSSKINTLVERVQTLEAIQQTLSKKDLSIYQRNYQSAIVNLVSMERELKPLILFNASQDFFQSLTDMSNPLRYEDYRAWYTEFKQFVTEKKEKDPTLMVLGNIINLTGDLTKGAPLAGPFLQVLFDGMGKFVASMGTQKKEIRDKSAKMFELTVVLSQFHHDQQAIEDEWTTINAELSDLKRLHEEALNLNFDMLKIQRASFERSFTKETDANKRLEYLNWLTKTVETNVIQQKEQNPDRWKETYFKQMATVQSLKIRFGQITVQIKENIERYNELLAKYRNNAFLKAKIPVLESKLTQLSGAFDATFNPRDYIDAATGMYIVN